MDLLVMKSLHIIGVVVWFAGLFYIGRLFVYHKEVEDRPETEREVLTAQFALMEKRLWFAITWPGMVVTLLMGFGLLRYYGFPSWLHAKLLLVVVLVGYHLLCGRLRKQLLAGQCSWSGKQLRMFNEVPSLLLIAIVFAVVLKDQLSWPIFIGILVGVGVLMGVMVQYLAKRRKRKASSAS